MKKKVIKIRKPIVIRLADEIAIEVVAEDGADLDKAMAEVNWEQVAYDVMTSRPDTLWEIERDIEVTLEYDIDARCEVNIKVKGFVDETRLEVEDA